MSRVSVQLEHARQWAVDALVAARTPVSLAERVVGDLIRNECDGYPSHGLQRVPTYLADIAEGVLDPLAVPSSEHLGRGRVAVLGNRSFGALVADAVADELRSACSEAGIAVTSVRGAHHLGRLASLGRKLASGPDPLTVVGFCNYQGTGLRMAYPGESQPALSTNPLLIATPVADADPYILDMSTTISSEGRIHFAAIGGDLLAPGYLIDADLKAVPDPAALYSNPPTATMAPLGYPLAPHKGFGLALAIELLVGAVGGAGHVGDSGKGGNDGLFIGISAAALVGDADGAKVARQILDCVVPRNARRAGASRDRDQKPRDLLLAASLVEELRSGPLNPGGRGSRTPQDEHSRSNALH